MSGETNLKNLIREMNPILNVGEYVFSTVSDINTVLRSDTLFEFKEEEGTTIILSKEKADKLNLPYHYIASWITLKVHSSLEAVGLTAAFSTELTKHNISCNVVAGYYHDHIFLDKKDEQKAMKALKNLSNRF